MELMSSNPIPTHHGRSIRLPQYDYSQDGWYFISLVTRNRDCLFGNILYGKLGLSKFGVAVEREWFRTKELRLNVDLFT
jgi:putative transposase